MLFRAAVAVALLVLPVAASSASASVRPGSYAGVTSASVQGYNDENAHLDKGTLTFAVREGKVRDFSVRGQQATCGGQVPVARFEIPTIRLSSDGKGIGRYSHPVLGAIRVTIAVTSHGTARGRIRFGGLCSTTASYTARRHA